METISARKLKQREHARAYYARNREACIERAKKYREANPEYYAEKSIQHRKSGKANEATKRHYQRHKERILAKQKERRAQTKEIAAYQAALRRARIAKAVPAWADKNAIKEIYRNRPEAHHVDHIVPIAGKYVCGLHVEYNLQYLPAIENLTKNNRY